MLARMSHDIIAERTLSYHDGQTTKPVIVRIHRPYQRPTGEWACLLEIDGPRPHRREYGGADSAEALFCALRIVQIQLEDYGDQLKWRGTKPWIEIALLV